MSVLSNPQGTPERVWSLVGGLSALGGTTDRQSFDRLINPGFEKDGLSVRTDSKLAGNALGAASSMKLVDANREQAVLAEGFSLESASDFADCLHDHLLAGKASESDRVLLEGYAWIAAESDRRGDLAWIYEMTAAEFADFANTGLVGEDEDGKPMNSTKAVAWRRWLSFLGLGVALPLPAVDYPSPAARIAREIERAKLSTEQPLTADAFIELLATRMPYLDRGKLYRQACERIGHQARDRRLSPLLSAGLRDLHDEGVIRMQARGDSAGAVALSDDRDHAIQTFNLVFTGEREGAAA